MLLLETAKAGRVMEVKRISSDNVGIARCSEITSKECLARMDRIVLVQAYCYVYEKQIRTDVE